MCRARDVEARAFHDSRGRGNAAAPVEHCGRPVHDLLAKYHEMRAMRADDAAGLSADPRPRMRALAERFPGALREIDELPPALLDARIAALEAARRGEAPLPRWARAATDYHGWMRAILRLRRVAGRLRDRPSALAWIAGSYAPSGDEPAAPELEAVVEQVLRPPRGRLNPWLFAHLAGRHGLSAAELEAEIFPPSPRRRSTRSRHAPPEA